MAYVAALQSTRPCTDNPYTARPDGAPVYAWGTQLPRYRAAQDLQVHQEDIDPRRSVASARDVADYYLRSGVNIKHPDKKRTSVQAVAKAQEWQLQIPTAVRPTGNASAYAEGQTPGGIPLARQHIAPTAEQTARTLTALQCINPNTLEHFARNMEDIIDAMASCASPALALRGAMSSNAKGSLDTISARRLDLSCDFKDLKVGLLTGPLAVLGLVHLPTQAETQEHGGMLTPEQYWIIAHRRACDWLQITPNPERPTQAHAVADLMAGLSLRMTAMFCAGSLTPNPTPNEFVTLFNDGVYSAKPALCQTIEVRHPGLVSADLSVLGQQAKEDKQLIGNIFDTRLFKPLTRGAVDAGLLRPADFVVRQQKMMLDLRIPTIEATAMTLARTHHAENQDDAGAMQVPTTFVNGNHAEVFIRCKVGDRAYWIHFGGAIDDFENAEIFVSPLAPLSEKPPTSTISFLFVNAYYGRNIADERNTDGDMFRVTEIDTEGKAQFARATADSQGRLTIKTSTEQVPGAVVVVLQEDAL